MTGSFRVFHIIKRLCFLRDRRNGLRAYELLDACYEHGINFNDTAKNYESGDSERYVDEWLADRDREDFVIVSKVYWASSSIANPSLPRKNVRSEIDGTLDRLETNHLSTYYIHSVNQFERIGEAGDGC